MNAYIEAGADIAFVESPESIEEMQMINKQIAAPTLANMVEGGRTPFIKTSELQSSDTILLYIQVLWDEF